MIERTDKQPGDALEGLSQSANIASDGSSGFKTHLTTMLKVIM